MKVGLEILILVFRTSRILETGLKLCFTICVTIVSEFEKHSMLPR